MFDFGMVDWVIVIFCAMAIGLSKSGLPNMVILVVTMMMFVFPARESVGILLPMLLVGDLFAVTYYRRSVVWKHLISLIPWVLIGVFIGYFVLFAINSEQLEPLIGMIVLAMIGIHVMRSKFGEKFNQRLPKSMGFTALIGILGGFTTMIGNAAGGIMAIYLLVKGLPKKEFVGTGAWFFLFVNVVKFPLYLHLGLITGESLIFNSWMIPAIVIGALIGVKILPLIPQKVFQTLVLVLAAIGGINLLF
ncbi:sulfite exporter TauE/SafE family protein [Oceanobacillus bengalensis]|uniref:Probable membrane transporter protein n=1 Tax=Oceanobacillus bengalensis TaxID=1435466 RepID=A0A494YX47_9BACI|nr:sulfite exporter TauE/SafE family protein [Oceanobacillus bengalensis]RKQ14789.1 sulfite exporter TauE/SafE family protein [Oceanobacillus bengalensis]